MKIDILRRTVYCLVIVLLIVTFFYLGNHSNENQRFDASSMDLQSSKDTIPELRSDINRMDLNHIDDGL